MKSKKTFFAIILVWVALALITYALVPVLETRAYINQRIDLLLLLAGIVLVMSISHRFLASTKFKNVWVCLIALLFYPILWLFIYLQLPYGNHFMIAWKAQPGFNINFYSKNLSNYILNTKGISCDFPLVVNRGLRVEQYESSKNRTISTLMSLYRSDTKVNKIENEFILNYLFKTIEKCDVDSNNPLINAVIYDDFELVSTFVKRGANVNQPFIDEKISRSYSSLYFAEEHLKRAKTEESKQNIIKIIDLLKQAGAKSEKIDLPAKTTVN